MKKITQTLALAISFAFIFAGNAVAQSAMGLSAIPPRLEVTANPGSVVTKEIKVRNESKTEKIITTSSKDFIVTDDNGTPIQVQGTDDSANRWASSAWIQVSPSNFKLKPGETKSLMLTIITPDDALPGGHYAMILHSPKNESVLTSTGSFIETNVGTLLYITVPGDIKEKALIKEFTAPFFSEYGPINFNTIVTNLSDIHITPAGSIAIKNWFGGKTADLALTPTNIFPNTSRSLQNTLAQKWLFGRYTAQLNAGYGTTGQMLAATIIFWVIPWKLMIMVTLAILLAVAIYFLVKKNTPPTVTPVENEQVIELEKELETLKKKYQDRK